VYLYARSLASLNSNNKHFITRSSIYLMTKIISPPGIQSPKIRYAKVALLNEKSIFSISNGVKHKYYRTKRIYRY